MSKTASEMLKEFADEILQDMESTYKLEPKSIKPSGVEYSESVAEIFNDAVNKAKASTKQIGGTHYSKKSIQPWDYIVSNNMGYLAGNIIKYVSRYKDKNGIEDLKKAMHYLEKLIEVEENDNK